MRRALVGVAVLAGCGTPATPPDYALGTSTRTYVDASRPTPANGTAPAQPSRTLVTEVWYPAMSEGRDAPPAGGRFPLAVFVHGSGGNRRQSTFLTEALATFGYVVAAADFPLTAADTPGGASDDHVGDQLGDVAFLAAQVGGEFAVDEARGYAVVGHSTGGTIALLSAYAPDPHDPKIAAAAALAPCACFLGDALFQTRALPLLVIAGTDDLFVPPASNGQRAYSLAPQPKQLVLLSGGNHLYFTDFDIPDSSLNPMPTTVDDPIAKALVAYGGGTACSPPPPPGTDPAITIDQQHAQTLASIRPFLDGVFGR